MNPIRGQPSEFQFLSGAKVRTFPLPPRGIRMVDVSDAELARYGLPTRRQFQAVPVLRTILENAFHRELSLIAPEFELSPRVRRQPYVSSGLNSIQSQNWSGVVSLARSGDLVTGAVAGTWNVPDVASVDGGEDHCSIWVGIDGAWELDPASNGDLVGAGVEAIADGSGKPTYYASWEWLSSSVRIRETRINNFTVLPETYFECQIWLTSKTTADVYMFTTAAGVLTSTLFQITAPPTVSLIGGCAEWIVERSQLVDSNGHQAYAVLPAYGSVEFSSALAWKPRTTRCSLARESHSTWQTATGSIRAHRSPAKG